MTTSYPHLLSPITIGRTTLANRVVMGAMHTRIDHMDRPEERIAAFYRARATGGVAMIITGGVSPNPEGRFEAEGPLIAEGTDLDWHRAVVGSVEGTSTKICMQILHAGRYARLKGCVGPSAIKSRINPHAPRALETAEVWRTVDDFARAAELARDLGYHGVEIMGSEGYLINEFTAPATNDRLDEFGRDFDGRVRFPLEIIRATRKRVGLDFIIVFRISAADLVPAGMAGAETARYARLVQDAGADAINIGVGWHESVVPTIAHVVPRAAFAYTSRSIRNAVTIPVIGSNRINDPQVAENLIAAGDADLVAMARPMLSDPDFVRKAEAGQAHRINICIACNQACLDGYFTRRGVSCLVNPRAGYEPDFIPREPQRRKRIAVVGGGAAGMNFAFNAAELGHEVTLFEASDALGGQLLMARNVPGKTEFDHMLRYFALRLHETGVDVRLRNRPPARQLAQGGFDDIVIATGVVPRHLDIPGSDHPNVCSYQDVLLRRRVAGPRVAIIGAGGIGYDVAEYLLGGEPHVPPRLADFAVEYGLDLSLEVAGGLASQPRAEAARRSVTMLQRKHGAFGKSLGASTGWIHRDRIARLGVELLGGVTYELIDDRGLHILIDGKPRLVLADTIIVCAGQEPERSLLRSLVALRPEAGVHLIGGADVASELDARRAIDQATRLAVAIGNDAGRTRHSSHERAGNTDFSSSA